MTFLFMISPFIINDNSNDKDDKNLSNSSSNYEGNVYSFPWFIVFILAVTLSPFLVIARIFMFLSR